jgi:hypothetical protein
VFLAMLDPGLGENLGLKARRTIRAVWRPGSLGRQPPRRWAGPSVAQKSVRRFGTIEGVLNGWRDVGRRDAAPAVWVKPEHGRDEVVVACLRTLS